VFSHQTLILGIASPGRSDEDPGIRALQAFRKFHPGLPGVTCIDFDGPFRALVEPMAGARHLIVFDVAQFGASPGTIRCLVGPEMDEYLQRTDLSATETALARLLDTVRIHGTGPIRRALIGIQDDCSDNGAVNAVSGALPWAAALARELVERWNNEKDPDPVAPRPGLTKPSISRSDDRQS
jgi:hydrogenase maturation protease